MGQGDTEYKKGDRVWIQEHDYNGEPTHLRIAEVIAMMHMPIYGKDKPYITIHYLDNGIKNYECIPLERVKGLCEDGELNY